MKMNIFCSLIIIMFLHEIISIQLETQIINNVIQAQILASCPLQVKSFGLYASINLSQNISLSIIKTKFTNFKEVNKLSQNWEFFYYEKFDVAESYTSSKLTFPIKSQANYSVIVYCDDYIEKEFFQSPVSAAKTLILSAKYKNNQNLTNFDVNNLICSLNEIAKIHNSLSFSPKYKDCKIEKLIKTQTKEKNFEHFISLIPDWSIFNFDKQITIYDLSQILKKSPLLKSLEIYDQISEWYNFPNITIEKLHTKEFELEPSISLEITNFANAGYVYLLIKSENHSLPSKEEMINGGNYYYMKNNSRKNIRFHDFEEFTNNTLYYMTSSSDTSSNGVKSKIFKAFQFVTTPNYNISFENSLISIKVWSKKEFNLFVGIGDERNQKPTLQTMLSNDPKDGLMKDFNLIGQKLSSKTVKISGKNNIFECFFYFTITSLKKQINLWISAQSSNDKHPHDIITFTKESPKLEKMMLIYDASFNVDPSEFLGFKNYRIKSSVNGRIYIILIDNADSNIPNREFIKQAVDGTQTQDFTVIKAWQGDIKAGVYYKISYENDEEDDEDLQELRENHIYRLIFYGSSKITLKDSDVITRNFMTPNTALLYACEDE